MKCARNQRNPLRLELRSNNSIHPLARQALLVLLQQTSFARVVKSDFECLYVQFKFLLIIRGKVLSISRAYRCSIGYFSRSHSSTLVDREEDFFLGLALLLIERHAEACPLLVVDEIIPFPILIRLDDNVFLTCRLCVGRMSCYSAILRRLRYRQPMSRYRGRASCRSRRSPHKCYHSGIG